MNKFLLAAASILMMWANGAGATIIVINPPARVLEFNGTVFDWTYAAVLQPGISMKPGDFFTIYDFPFANLLSKPTFGVTSGDDNALFSVSVQNTGVTNPKTAPTDSPSITNVTVTLLDGDSTQAGDQDLSAGAGGLQLGTLIVRSPTRLVAQSLFSSVLDNNTATPQATVGPIEVAAIPEPGSITLLLTGLLACGAASFWRRKSVD